MHFAYFFWFVVDNTQMQHYTKRIRLTFSQLLLEGVLCELLKMPRYEKMKF